MNCRNCGKEVDAKAVICTGCGCSLKEKSPAYKKWWFWVLIGLLVIIIAAAASSGDSTENLPTDGAASGGNTVVTQHIPSEFSTACPISVSASVSDNIIGVPELRCNIKNATDKEIAAVKLYFLPKDVYGEDVKSVFTTNHLTTDEPIGAKGSCSRSWQMLDSEVKSGDLYIYSVYFADGTEWGDKDASASQIKKYGVKVVAGS